MQTATLSRSTRFLACLMLSFGLSPIVASGFQEAVPVDSRNILSERERARIMDDWPKWRLDNILPGLMRRAGIDLWLVIVNESDPGPVYFTLMPATTLYVVRTSILLHCDVGVKYLGLHTDMQWSAYVLKTDETDAPSGLKNALARANRLAEIFMADFKEGRSGNEIVEEAMKKGEAEGLRPLIYTHPIGTYGHAAGPPMDARTPENAPENTRIRGEYPLYPDTAYSIESSATTSIAEWDNQDVRIGYEEDAVFSGGGCRFIDGHQTMLLLIK